jgi:predicted type IV restriction endonuclease
VTEPATNVVAISDGQPILEESTKKVVRSAPKFETEGKERLRTWIRKFNKPLTDLVGRDANEGDTRLLVTDFLCDALGYDKYSDLTTEYQVKGEFADYGIRIDKQLVAFIEVKRVATKLDAKHLRQVEMYAVNEGVEWVMLTNAVDWRVYHITGGLPVAIDLAVDVNLLSEDTVTQKANQLFYLSRESMKRRQIDELWKAKRATSPKSVAQALLSETVLTALHRELRRQTGHSVDNAELAGVLRSTVLRAECFEK